MSAPAEAKDDPLFAGFYTLKDAARLLQMDGGHRRLQGWLNGWRGSKSGPVIKRDFEGATISFLDLMEIRFVQHFRRQDVPMQTIRRAAQMLRSDWGERHPLAFANSEKYVTDRRRIFAQAAEQEGDRRTWDVASNQYEMWVALENVIAKGVTFDPSSHLATSWQPLRAEFPGVVVDPRMAFGRPVVSGDRPTPTAALFRQWRAENGNVDQVARWFKVEPSAVDEAVGFELSLAA